jgi:hypothetical protein
MSPVFSKVSNIVFGGSNELEHWLMHAIVLYQCMDGVVHAVNKLPLQRLAHGPTRAIVMLFLLRCRIDGESRAVRQPKRLKNDAAMNSLPAYLPVSTPL